MQTNFTASKLASIPTCLWPSRLVPCLLLAWCGLALAEPRKLEATRPVDVSPLGWRRTVDGWERAETWKQGGLHATQTIHHWVAQDRLRERAFTGTALERLRQIHPLTCSLTLVLVVFSIILVGECLAGQRAARVGSSRVGASRRWPGLGWASHWASEHRVSLKAARQGEPSPPTGHTSSIAR